MERAGGEAVALGEPSHPADEGGAGVLAHPTPLRRLQVVRGRLGFGFVLLGPEGGLEVFVVAVIETAELRKNPRGVVVVVEGAAVADRSSGRHRYGGLLHARLDDVAVVVVVARVPRCWNLHGKGSSAVGVKGVAVVVDR